MARCRWIKLKIVLDHSEIPTQTLAAAPASASGTTVAAPEKGAIRFDRNELAGAFGDIGTDFPLLVGLVLAAKLDSASVLILFGAMQILTGLFYRMPMPVQPLKAMAALVISQKLAGNVLFGAGLAIGLVMLVLALTGLTEWLARVVPKTVVRGIQFGLGLQLATLALRDFVQADGRNGYLLAGAAYTSKISGKGGRVDTLMKSGASDRPIIENLYLASFSRFPSPEELTAIEEKLRNSSSHREAVEDTVWALISSREFAYNH